MSDCKNKPLKNSVFYDDVYYAPLKPNSKTIVAIKINNEHNGFKYDVVGSFDLSELPKSIQILIQNLQEKIETTRYKRKLNHLKKELNKISKKF